jgi:hypothetical protein
MSTCLPKPAAAARAPGLGSFGVFSMSGRGSGSGPPPPGGSYQVGPGLGDVIMHATSALRVPPRAKCHERAERLNNLFSRGRAGM